MAKLNNLTNTQIERAKATSRVQILNDGQGLFLEIKPTGTKAFRFRYNQPITKKRTKITIGNYPAVTLAQARKHKDEYLTLLSKGIDPQTYRQKLQTDLLAQASNTFLAVANKWKEKKRHEVMELTLSKYWRSLELHVLPTLANVPITDIKPPLVIAILEKRTPDMSHRLNGYINDILNYAVNSGLLEYNPCMRVSATLKPINKSNNPHIDIEELPAFLLDLKRATIHIQTKAVILFQLLTMTRPNEAVTAEWADFDFKARLWTIPPERMKQRKIHTIPLSDEVIEILDLMRPLTGRYKYVFPLLSDATRPMNESTSNNAIKKSIGHNGKYKGRQTAHGLRGLARTYFADIGIQHEHAEACLSHKVGSAVSLAYNHSTYLEQRKEIMALWGRFIKECSNNELF
ncbi:MULTISPECIES: tyrosine-type recombinase/integrase [Pasteurellaceae]|uniref:Integrase arm-type DNA-binding domain-containing protein n=1 Tax=Pasteurella atlantica TaxID=2827233 RepID=A0AAW8CEK9_9PAST|nr:integrase arm-type DNA-binding domain-containing protein [Pasteurella atlantica]MBR0573862.1 integrase arm-type DNA-binding domain-containing protein [Pasteurella atlantica]MDP8039254.1 integrase arm-type DNA-binding domain-containing protein [Pasteurella atlantica]MDP8041345.1 integrase arm-type DNA-binding domain-containing protein [Pasteurella atlantica]MDP8045600.1 integrase arm-type DNA-binding domain-containing protein [Pasteurella atlantica]MDP8061454.1 integrase arm-type DNA-binding